MMGYQGPNGTIINKEYDRLAYNGYYSHKNDNRKKFVSCKLSIKK